MRRLTTVMLLGVLCGAAARPVAGQHASPIDQLISRARRALDDLDYERAQTIARTLLDMRGEATASQRITGLQLMVAALFPEEEAAQRPDSARRYLRKLILAGPDVSIPRSVSWPGLDSLLATTRQATFAVWSSPESTYYRGSDDAIEIGVAASRAAWFRLAAVPEGSTDTITLDVAGPAPTATLQLPILVGDRPLLTWGRYALLIIGTDTLSGDDLQLQFTATVDAPPFQLLDIPAALDSSALLPERGPRRTQRNILIGLGLGAATAFAATLFVGSDDVASASSPTNAYAVGVGMTVGALLGVFTNRGALLTDNVEHNERIEAGFRERVRRLQAENTGRRAAYRAMITIEGI